jgi:hypothetical protein
MMSPALIAYKARFGTSVVVAAIGVGLLVGGCSRSNSLAIVENRAYPTELMQREVLDVHIIKHPTEIEFTNTSDRTLGPGTLWLNGRYGKEIEAVPSGATVRYTLIEFKDQWNDHFRRGGFWAKENPEVLYLTQLETGTGDAQQLVGFISIRAEE